VRGLLKHTRKEEENIEFLQLNARNLEENLGKGVEENLGKGNLI